MDLESDAQDILTLIIYVCFRPESEKDSSRTESMGDVIITIPVNGHLSRNTRLPKITSITKQR